MFPSGITEKWDTVSLETLFWLAHGFLPSGTDADGKQVVICLEDPSNDINRLQYLRHEEALKPIFISLQNDDSAEIPVSIDTSVQCLGLREVRVEQFLPNTPPQPARHLSATDVKAPSWVRMDSHPIFGEDWVEIPSLEGQLYQRKDLNKVLQALLRPEWDQWGYLLWKENTQFLRVLLKGAAQILTMRTRASRLVACGVISESKAIRWRLNSDFSAEKTSNYYLFSEHLRELLDETEARPIRIPLAALFILNKSFRLLVEHFIETVVEEFGLLLP